jgi:hypothetical protein
MAQVSSGLERKYCVCVLTLLFVVCVGGGGGWRAGLCLMVLKQLCELTEW